MTSNHFGQQDESVAERDVAVAAGHSVLAGTLSTPPGAAGIVVFAHGSGSSRFSPRNRYVARQLQRAGLATILIDLLTPEEEQRDLRTRQHRFDLGLLAARLAAASDWLQRDHDLSALPVGYFGASTGAAAALIAAAQRPDRTDAVVSRGGRPDLAGDALKLVRAPTLLIVGGHDTPVIGLNQLAFGQLAAREKQLVLVPGATHLFEESGALEEVAELAAEWFTRYLVQARQVRAA